MIENAQTLLRSCSPLTVSGPLCLAAILYTRGWTRLCAARPNLISPWRLTAFLAGLAVVWLSIGSPLEALDEASLTVHMVQHVLLMSVSPPLILLGWPALPLLRGSPQSVVRRAIGPFLRLKAVKHARHLVANPVVCWFAAILALVVWHVPGVFEAALRRDWLHELEHASFLATGLLFWWPVVQPWPSVPRAPRWSIPLYLFLATLPCDMLSGFLAFCDRVVYSSHPSAPRIFGMSALQDQECAAAFMWVSVTVILLVPAVMVTMEFLSPQTNRPEQELRVASAAANRCLEVL